MGGAETFLLRLLKELHEQFSIHPFLYELTPSEKTSEFRNYFLKKTRVTILAPFQTKNNLIDIICWKINALTYRLLNWPFYKNYLCKRGILLKNGPIEKVGPIHEIVSAYLQNNNKEIDASRDLSKIDDREGNGAIQFSHYNITDSEGKELSHVLSVQDLTFELCFNVNVPKEYSTLHFSVAITDEMNRNLIYLSTTESLGKELSLSSDITSGKVRCSIKNLPLPADNYYLSFFVSDLLDVFDRIDGGGMLTIEDGNFFSNGKKKDASLTCFLAKSEWEIVPNTDETR